MSDQLQAVAISHYEALIEEWPFFLEGLEQLNATLEEPMSPESFFQVHFDIASNMVPGVILKITSKNFKPFGFLTAVDDSSKYRQIRSALVYAIYSNNKSQHAPRFAFDQVEKWARDHDYKELHANSARTSGASIRWCKFKFGLTLSKLYFTKKL